jgi:hypothetical protein
MRYCPWPALALLLIATTAQVAQAQSSGSSGLLASDRLTPATAAPAVVPELLPLAEAYRFDAEAAPRLAPAGEAALYQAVQRDRRRGVTYALVGLALIGTGSLIDGGAGTAVSVGGAVVTAYGVFLLVRR